MMKLIAALLLGLVVVIATKGDRPTTRCYLGFILVSAGVLLWSATFDALAPGKDVAGDADLYRRVLLLSATGIVVSVAGVIATLGCRQKPLRTSTILLGAASTIMCSVNIVVPY